MQTTTPRRTQPHSLLRLLIRKKSFTDQGFVLADADGMEASHYASRHAGRMVTAGDLFRSKVKGHPIHYMRTQAQADRMTASLKPRNRTPKPTPNPTKAALIRQLMLQKAATPDGFIQSEFESMADYLGMLTQMACRLIASGHLLRAKAKGHPFRYFVTEAHALAWQAASVVPKRIKKPKVAKPPPAKLAPLKRKEIFIKQALKAATAPRKDAEIVWPAHIRTQYSPFVDLRALNASNVPRQLIGTPSWVSL